MYDGFLRGIFLIVFEEDDLVILATGENQVSFGVEGNQFDGASDHGIGVDFYLFDDELCSLLYIILACFR